MALKETKVTLVNAEFLNHFLSAAYDTFMYETGTELERVNLAFDASPHTTNEITVMFGVIGNVRGSVSLCMSENTAKKLACALLKYDINDFNMVTRAIYAMGQEISNRASEYLNNQGLDCFATPPTVVCGKGVKMSSPNLNRVSVGMNSKLGPIELKAAFAG